MVDVTGTVAKRERKHKKRNEENRQGFKISSCLRYENSSANIKYADSRIGKIAESIKNTVKTTYTGAKGS